MRYRIPVYEPEITKDDIDTVTEAVSSGWVSSKGPFIEQLERDFSNYVGTRNGVSTSNGTTALHLALVALGIGPGDEVIVPSLTFIAVANVVHYTGATPVFVDSNQQYWCMEPSNLAQGINRKTKAIIAVHTYGHPCDMERIGAIARENHLALIEDCAEAHGAEYKGRKVGTFGRISCFSFYGNKIMTTGEGGICLTDDEELSEKMRILRDHGMNPHKKYWHDVVGFNYRMTNLQAALGVSQLRRIDSLIERKRALAMMYAKQLADTGIVPAAEMKWAKNVYWLYSALVKGGRRGRDHAIQRLKAHGIESRPFFYPIHTLPPYRSGQHLSVADYLSSSGINLPSGPQLTKADVEEVVGVLRSSEK